MRIFLIIVACIVLIGVVFASCAVSYKNQEAGLRNAITAKQKDNTSEYDNMWKKISQSAQISEKDREGLKDIFVSHAQARTTGGSQDGSLMKWVTESVPNIDSSIMKNLMNIVTSSRDSWTQRQKEILDLKRTHDNLIDKWPSGMFIAWFGNNQKIDVQIVTSSKTEEAFRTGKDDDTDVFKK